MNCDLKTQLLALAVLATLIPRQSAASGPATLPSNGSYTAGKGTISAAGNAVTINQSSNRGVIDWNNFSIGPTGLVSFQNGSGATLNLVNGGAITSICWIVDCHRQSFHHQSARGSSSAQPAR